MKKQKRILLLVLILFAGNLFAQGGWQWINPSALSSRNYLSSFAIDNSTGWLSDNAGRLLKTTNAGVNWTVLFTDNAMEINSVFFVNSSTGWICGTQGKIYKTTNGGASWNISATGTTNFLNTIYFADANTGFACGEACIILRTTNSGVNWASSSLPYPSTSLNSIRFFNSSTGVVFAKNNFTAAAFKTTNGGLNWFNFSAGIRACEQAYFIDETKGWLVSNDTGWPTIKRTTNGGLNWTDGNGLGSSFLNYTRCVYFINALTGFASCVDGEIYKSTDGGVNWEQKSGNNHIANHFISAFDANNIIVSGDAESIFRTTDAGANWYLNYSYKFVNNMNEVKFINALTGYFCGQGGRVVRTTNGGATLDTFSTGYSELFSISMGNATTGWVSGSGVLKKTTNGGNTWLNETPSAGDSLFSIYFYGLDTGWAGGMHGRLYKTMNGGDTWINQSFNTTDICRQIQFINAQTGYFITTGKLYKTSNGGTNWSPIYSVSADFKDFQFLNEQTGWLLNLTNIHKTTNGGTSWTVTPNPQNDGKSLCFANALTGYYTGSINIYKSTDGGANWTQQFNSPSSVFNSVFFINDNTGWVTGNFGHILKTTNGGVTFISQTSADIPEGYSLKQNYPNPFNPETKINYEIKTSGHVTLKVYDLLGNEVASLVDENQTAGSYSLNFHAGELKLASGIYFYTLSAGEFKETKRMVLIK